MSQDYLPLDNPPDQDAMAWVIGGVGGIRFQFDELDRGALAIEGAVERLREVVDGTGWMAVGITNMQNTPAGAQAHTAGSLALEAHHLAQAGLLTAKSELEGAITRIRLSRVAYEMAELSLGLQFAAGAAVFRDLNSSANALPFLSLPLAITETKTSEICLSGTVGALLARVPAVREEPGSAFEVLEVEGEDGPTFVVVLQGTEGSEWEDPFSNFGILEAEQADSRYVNNAVARGLAEVGAPEGANVVLVGYSQGGMHAMNLANSGPVQENYSVSTVITAGSPTDDEVAPAGTNYLHLKHRLDLVPEGDLARAVDARNQVSVLLDNPVYLAPGEEFGLGPAHKLQSYQTGASAVDASTHPSVAPVTAALGAALAGGVAKRHVFSVARPPLAPPRPSPSGTGAGKPGGHRVRNLGR